MIRTAIADDQPLVRAGLRSIFDHADDITVVAEAGDGRAAVEIAGTERPDVLLMDIRMPILDGIEATRLISSDADLAQVRVLILTTFDLDEYVYAALRAGASGFLLKDAPPERVFESVVGQQRPSPPEIARLLGALTDREREVLALVGRGLSNAEISARLVVSEATTKTHISRVLAKSHARDRAQLVVLAYEGGLVHPGRS